jgi:ribosomal protein L37AE/L43A
MTVGTCPVCDSNNVNYSKTVGYRCLHCGWNQKQFPMEDAK